MIKLVQLISWLSLGLIVVAPSLFYVDSITLETSKLLMMVATFFWFASALCWMGRRT